MPPSTSISARFDATGGTIGRAATNMLVLDDPERTVSRVHAQVLCRDGQFFVIDRGSNPLLVNGRALGAGNETPLAANDRLVIGGFELKVELPADTARTAVGRPAAPSVPVDDPFADLLADLAPPSVSPVVRAPEAASADLSLFANPMESGAPKRGAAAVDPFADLLGPAPKPTPASGLGALDGFSDLGGPRAEANRTASTICSVAWVAWARGAIRSRCRCWPIRWCNPTPRPARILWPRCRASPVPVSRRAAVTCRSSGSATCHLGLSRRPRRRQGQRPLPPQCLPLRRWRSTMKPDCRSRRPRRRWSIRLRILCRPRSHPWRGLCR